MISAADLKTNACLSLCCQMKVCVFMSLLYGGFLLKLDLWPSGSS